MTIIHHKLAKHFKGKKAIHTVGLLKQVTASAITKAQYLKLEKLLIAKGAFNFPRSTLAKNNKEFSKLTVLRAANTPMWPMGTHYWVRDNALIGERLIDISIEDGAYARKLRSLGKDLLLAGITIMSTKSQRQRFQTVIESSSETETGDASLWPQIFLGIADNLIGERHEPWAHKQDAWQILAHSVLKKLESGSLSINLLTHDNRDFFALLAPFLAKVRFYSQPNSGSWEELEAVRSSVIAWDMALLHQIYRMSFGERYSFLEEGFIRYKHILSEYGDTSSFTAFLHSLLKRGAAHLERTIPYECPQYPADDPRHRLADGALIYLLQLDTPKLVAEILGLSDSWISDSEAQLLKSIASLYDPRSGGHCRYQNDSYQRFGFFRSETIAKLSELYGAPSGDASAHFVGRDRVVPKGPEASWSHFTWQLSAWAGRRYLETKNKKYLKLQHSFFAKGLRTVSPHLQYSIEQTQGGKAKVIKLPAYRFPECLLSEEDQNKRRFIFPSPHTPLNWATAEALDAFSALRKSYSL